MSTSTIESRIAFTDDLPSLELAGVSASDAPAFFGHIAHKVAQAYFQVVGCGDNVIHRVDRPTEIGEAVADRSSVLELLSSRERALS